MVYLLICKCVTVCLFIFCLLDSVIVYNKICLRLSTNGSTSHMCNTIMFVINVMFVRKIYFSQSLTCGFIR